MVLPSFTKTYHHTPYPAIDPTRPELSAAGKIVVITGGGTGIGSATALAFAKAGSKAIVLVGRRPQPLEETKSSVEATHPHTKIVTRSVDISDESAVSALFTEIFKTLGPVDICVNGAGYLSDKGTVTETSLSNFWAAFEINVKGAFLVARNFLKNAGPDPVLIGLNSLASHLPASQVELAPASYASSKIAQAKLYECIAFENSHLRIYSVQPGVIKSDMSAKSIAMGNPEEKSPFEPWDDISLPAHFFVWLSSKEGAVVPSGKYLWSNWDVDGLKERSQELFEDKLALTHTLPGWPFPIPSVEV